ncbi:MAG: ABA4-like family protein [Micromonosporaceae bacterium]
MSAGLLFQLSFLVTVPFWALMILAPTWSGSRRIIGSPLIVLPAVAVCLVLYLQVFGPLWTLVLQPTLPGLRELVARPEALAGLWAQIIAWDLMVGRWVYLDSRQRRIHPLLMAPILVFTVLLSPFALPVYLAVRVAFPVRSEPAAA